MTADYTCEKCNAPMEGDGFSRVLHCENADESTYNTHAPDEGPVYCTYPIITDESHQIKQKDWGYDTPHPQKKET